MPGWQTLDRRTLWQSRWYHLRQDRVRLPTGQIASPLKRSVNHD